MELILPLNRKENFIHVVLLLQGPPDFTPRQDEIVINWTEIRDSYNMKSDNYFYQRLVVACQNTELMGRGTESYGANCTERLNYKKNNKVL